ncbi:TIGR03905 family TSCPD domain-containing protein [Desulfogranum japonicum]|uniref:TIGR03905 family TSCPD domain-containing protein n=1 Tax=Desulfogranum japonicum TaxID=231447 RepID=UPI0003FC55D3|nr:TIGR03905 family TSCPD domain-containing protein [Desulfogranum japonicum]
MQFLNIAEFARDNEGESFIPEGVCAKKITFSLEEGRVHNLNFVGGCQGNLSAISVLLEGMPAEEVIEKLKGIICGNKGTSCTDQLAKTLEKQLSIR